MGDLVVDTAAVVALYWPQDRNHPAAVRFLLELAPGRRFHLSNYILDEVMTRLRARAGHSAAVRVANVLREDPFHTIHQITEDLQEEAFDIFQRYSEVRLSFTDCTTVALMRRLEITDIFTFDRDFATLDLTVRP